jgi:pyruvate dehydrogenase E2 component (dihydrolipoamide acetyltransferase)
MSELKLPSLGERTSPPVFLCWFTRPGARFSAEQPICRLEGEEFIDILAPKPGEVVELLAETGRALSPGEALLRFRPADEAAALSAQSITNPLPQETPMSEAPAADAVYPVLLPQVGNDMEEGTIVAWKVAEGDRIEVGQVIFEVETDKATIEIEAEQAGRLAKIVVGEDETVAIRTRVAYLAEESVDVDAWIAAHGSQEETSAGTPEPAGVQIAPTPVGPSSAPPRAAAPSSIPAPETSGSGRPKASPAARKAAAQRGVDLALLPAGSGPGGRILSTDVSAAPTAGPPQPNIARIRPVGAALGDEEISRPVDKMRRAIARNLTRSKQTVPHFYLRLSIDAAPMLAFYRRRKEQYPLSLNDVILKAVAAAVSEYPAFRSRVDEDQLIERPGANIGIAVGTDDGLRVPVVMWADRLSLPELATESRRVIGNARAGKLENLGEGVFTISNLGMFGVEEFAAIINPPESGILAVGAAREDVLVRDGAMRIGRVCTMTLSCDHTVVDGLVAARFAGRLQELLEHPDVLDA